MPHGPLTRRQGGLLVKMIIVGMLVQLSVIFYVLNGQHDGCQRSKLDRAANAQGWRTAQKARLKTLAEAEDISYEEAEQLLRTDPKPSEPADLTAARRYNSISAGLERRGQVSCPGELLLGGIL